MSALGAQVSDLKAINETLKKYLEAVMKGITPADSNRLIQSEERRLQELERREKARVNPWCSYVSRHGSIPSDEVLDAISKATSFTDFAKRLKIGKEGIPRMSLYYSILNRIRLSTVALAGDRAAV